MDKQEIEIKKEKVKIFGDKIVRQKHRTLKIELNWAIVLLIIANIVPIVICIVSLFIAVESNHDFKFMHYEWEVFTWAMYIEIIVLAIVIFYVGRKLGGGKLGGLTKGFKGQQIQFHDTQIQRVRPLSRYLLNWVMYVIMLVAIIVPAIVMIIFGWIANANGYKFKFMYIEWDIFFWSLNIWFVILLITIFYVRAKSKGKSESGGGIGGIFSKFKGKGGNSGGDGMDIDKMIKQFKGGDSDGDGMDIGKMIEKFKE